MNELVAGGHYVALDSFTSDAGEEVNLTRLNSGGFMFTWIANDVLQGYFLDASGAATGGMVYLTNPEETSPAEASIAALPAGGFVAAWADSSLGLVVQMFDDAGAAVTPAVVLADGPSLGRYQQPSVATLSDGSFVVAFTIGNDGNADGIRAQLFDASGNKIGAEFNVNSVTLGSQVYSQAIALDSGGFLISWIDTWGHNIAAQFYHADGSPVGGQISFAAGDGVFDITTLASGNVVIVWPDANGELSGQIYDVNGTKIGQEFLINAPTSDIEILPEIAALPSGGFVVTWRSPTDDGVNFFQNGDIRAQVFGADGTPVGEEILVSTGPLGQSEPHIVSFGSDDFAISYIQYDEFGSSSVVMRTFYSALQGTEGPNVLVGTSDRDFIFGLGGNDQLSGGNGDDDLSGGNGNDTLDGGSGANWLDGGAGNDTLILGTSTEEFPRDSFGWGGSGADTITGGDGRDQIYSDQWQDPEEGYFPFDRYVPNSYHPPVLDRGTEVDTISAGAGDDFVSIGYGDSADGGSNDNWSVGDRLFLSLVASPTGVTADFRNTTLVIGGGTITGFEAVNYVEGSQFNDVFIFSSQAYPLLPDFGGASGGGTEISGLGGDDQITGGYYTNNIWGGDGNDLLDGSASQYLMYLDGGAGNDILIGSWVMSELNGGAGNDILTGGTGTDKLIGGSGNDTFKDTVAGLNGDTITDYMVGDRIVISDANLASFSFSLSGNTLTFTGGSLTLTGFTGRLEASAVAGGGVQLMVDAKNDFNGDGRSDVLWRNDNGTVTDWLGRSDGRFDGNTANANIKVGVDWHATGVGDFNGDGRDDVLWRNDNGALAEWLGQANGGFAANANANNNVATSWHVAGVGDFNGDGRDDILWRNADGTVTDWLGRTDGRFDGNTANANIKVGPGWEVAGVGDFNGDGRDDILWRNDTGALAEWLGKANGGFAANAGVANNVATSWHVAGVGDFNGDGRDDILWRNDNGTVTDWLGQSDGRFTGNTANANVTVGADWQVAGVGDFNGDGRDDILWRGDTGALAEWLGQANGGFHGNASANYNVATSWHVQSPDLV